MWLEFVRQKKEERDAQRGVSALEVYTMIPWNQSYQTDMHKVYEESNRVRGKKVTKQELVETS